MTLTYHLLSRHMRRFWGSAIRVPDTPQQSPKTTTEEKYERKKKQMHFNIKSVCVNAPWKKTNAH